MADVQGKILSKYGIDIAQENILKLYKIDNASISLQELEQKIQETRRRWNSSVNGANERNAERDRARLLNADKYEEILRNEKLRKELFAFYNKSAGGADGGAGSSQGNVAFAQEYFKLVDTTKNIKKSDVDFYFKYYQNERKNKKAILEMLTKDMKVVGLGKEEKYDKTENDEGKNKKTNSSLIVNLFQEATVLKIKRAIEKYEEAKSSAELCQRFPALNSSLYDLLGVDAVETAEQFKYVMHAKGQEVYNIKQERGAEYIPLVDMYNILEGIGDYKDVIDNILEFKLLLKYPNLTPYMYAFVEMKSSTVKGIMEVANRDNYFRNDVDFILNYYNPIHDNFGISNSGIGSIIKNAEKKAKQNKVLNAIDKKTGRNKNKNKNKMSLGAELIHFCAYWPVFLVYFLFEISKFLFSNLKKLYIPVWIIMLGLENLIFPSFGVGDMLVIRKIFFKNQWLSYLEGFFGTSGGNLFVTILLSILALVLVVLIYGIPAGMVTNFVDDVAADFNKGFDWVGIERTLQQIVDNLKKKSVEQFQTQRQFYFKRKLGKIITNLVCVVLIVAIILFAPGIIAMLA